MEIKIDVKPEDITKMVSEAVLKSSIGTEINRVITEAVAKLGNWDSPMKKAIEEVVHKEIINIVTKEHGEKIRSAVKAMITDQLVEEVSKAAWDSFFEKIDKRR
jgi:hypothetical protein